MSAVARMPLNGAAWGNLLEMWEDSPEHVELLMRMLSRAHRPTFGSITIQFERGNIVLLDERRTHKIGKEGARTLAENGSAE
jgi:hypothetical protein